MTPVAPSPYDAALDKNAANFAPLRPLTFIAWSAHVCPQRVAVIHGARRFMSWRDTHTRCCRLASALASRGIGIKDRAKDVIISGRENISSLEVEDAICHHPAVVAAAVVAQPDPMWGETPCAFVELKPGAQTTEAELIEHCRARLARFKAPKTILFGPLPRTSTGKVQKFVLRQRVRSAAATE